MQKMSDVYRISLRDYKAEARKRLNANCKVYDTLQNKESSYAQAIKALQDLHRQVLDIYESAPESLDI